MRITGWHVDGYGRFNDCGWSDLPTGLTIFHGPNEAGKSTLLSFLRSMLFGLKGGAHKDPAIRPLAGGTHGGRLWLADAHDATWTVQQHKPGGLRLEGPDGTVRDEAALAALLGNVGRDVFEAVFAFSLTELERLGGLDGDALRDQLFASTLTGGGSSAHAALDALQDRIDALYRPRKSSPLRDLDGRLKELRKARTTALAGAAEYAGLLAEERRLIGKHAALRGRTGELRRELDRLDRLGRLWAQLGPLGDARDESAALAGIASVADDVVERANGFVERRSTLAERAAAVTARRDERAEGPIREPDARLLDLADEIADRAAETAAQRDRLDRLPQLRAARTRTADRAADAVADLGPGWDPARVAAIDASHPARQAARELADAARRADEARERAEREHARAVSRTRAAAERVAKTREALVPDEPPAAGEIDAALAAVPDLRSAFQDRASRRRDVRSETEALERLRATAPRTGPSPTAPAAAGRTASAPGPAGRAAPSSAAASHDEPAAKRTTPTADGVRVSFLLLVGVLAVVVGVLLVVAGQPAGGGVVVLVGLVVAWVDRTDDGGDDGAATRSEEAARAAADAHAALVREQESRVEAKRQALIEAEERLTDAARRAGIDVGSLADASTTEPIERRTAELEAARDERRAFDRASAEVAAAVHDEEMARGEQERAAGDRADAVTAAERIDASWRARRDALDLPDDVTPQRAPELLDALLRARTALQEADAATAQVDEAAEACRRWTADVAGLVARAGWGPAGRGSADRSPADEQGSDGDPATPALTDPVVDRDIPPPPTLTDPVVALDTLVDLRRAVAEEVVLRAERQEHARDDARDEEELRELRRRIGSVDGELRELLATHGVEDVEALREARDTTRCRAALDERIAETERAIRRDAGAGADGEALTAEARSGDVTGWAARRIELDAELPRLDEEYREAVAAATGATAARRTLEDAVDLPRIDGEIEQARTDAARLLRDYRTLLRARGLIERTLDAFVRDQQPAVLRDASAWFQRITDGRYREVRQALTDGARASGRCATLRVITSSGEALDPAVLSRGTREQLYLCLRLALARGTAARTGPLPLVMDDVLVNFSPDRARAVADVVATVARDQQVLFFTCHPATRDLLVEASDRAGPDGAARVEELVR